MNYIIELLFQILVLYDNNIKNEESVLVKYYKNNPKDKNTNHNSQVKVIVKYHALFGNMSF